MNELLEKLLAAEVLTEETKSELKTAIETQINEAREAAQQEATAQVTEQLHQEWISQRDILIEAVDAKLSEVLEAELAELRGDIENYRDLEAEAGVRLIEAKETMAAQLAKDMEQLIENLDVFLEMRLTAEIDELKSGIEEARRNTFGKKIYEAFKSEFETNYSDEESAFARLSETEQRLSDTQQALAEAERTIARVERERKMSDVLKPLSGNARAREVMEAILKNVDTARLEEAYGVYVGRVLKDSAGTVAESKTSEKESTVLAEGKTEVVSGVVKTGNDNSAISEHAEITKRETVVSKPQLNEAELIRLRKNAGLF